MKAGTGKTDPGGLRRVILQDPIDDFIYYGRQWAEWCKAHRDQGGQVFFSNMIPKEMFTGWLDAEHGTNPVVRAFLDSGKDIWSQEEWQQVEDAIPALTAAEVIGLKRMFDGYLATPEGASFWDDIQLPPDHELPA